jgi:hypothetical protein
MVQQKRELNYESFEAVRWYGHSIIIISDGFIYAKKKNRALE